eukprot:6269923-Prymnesium_polylepis.1
MADLDRVPLQMTSDNTPSPGTMFRMFSQMQEKLDRVEKQSQQQQQQLRREQQQNDVKSALLGMPNSGKPAEKAALIQAMARRRVARGCLVIHRRAVVQVQRMVRGVSARRTYAVQHTSILVIQTTVRGLLAKCALHSRRKTCATTRIQACFRAFQVKTLHSSLRTKSSLVRELLHLRSLLHAKSAPDSSASSEERVRTQYTGGLTGRTKALDAMLLDSWSVCSAVNLTQLRFAPYLYMVLKQIHPDAEIADAALRVLDDIIIFLFRVIVDRSSKFTQHGMSAEKWREENPGVDHDELSAADIQAAVRVVIPGELAKHAVSEGTKAWSKFSSNVPNDWAEWAKRAAARWQGLGQERPHRDGRSAMAGLTLPVATVGVMLA